MVVPPTYERQLEWLKAHQQAAQLKAEKLERDKYKHLTFKPDTYTPDYVPGGEAKEKGQCPLSPRSKKQAELHVERQRKARNKPKKNPDPRGPLWSPPPTEENRLSPPPRGVPHTRLDLTNVEGSTTAESNTMSQSPGRRSPPRTTQPITPGNYSLPTASYNAHLSWTGSSQSKTRDTPRLISRPSPVVTLHSNNSPEPRKGNRGTGGSSANDQQQQQQQQQQPQLGATFSSSTGLRREHSLTRRGAGEGGIPTRQSRARTNAWDDNNNNVGFTGPSSTARRGGGSGRERRRPTLEVSTNNLSSSSNLNEEIDDEDEEELKFYEQLQRERKTWIKERSQLMTVIELQQRELSKRANSVQDRAAEIARDFAKSVLSYEERLMAAETNLHTEMKELRVLVSRIATDVQEIHAHEQGVYASPQQAIPGAVGSAAYGTTIGATMSNVAATGGGGGAFGFQSKAAKDAGAGKAAGKVSKGT